MQVLWFLPPANEWGTVPFDHYPDALNLTIQGAPSQEGSSPGSPVQEPNPPYPKPPSLYKGSSPQTCSNWYRLNLTVQGPRLPTCSNLFIMKYVWSTSRGLASCWNAYLLTFYTTLMTKFHEIS